MKKKLTKKKLQQGLTKYVHLDIFDESVAELCDELATAWARQAKKLTPSRPATRQI